MYRPEVIVSDPKFSFYCKNTRITLIRKSGGVPNFILITTSGDLEKTTDIQWRPIDTKEKFEKLWEFLMSLPK